MRSQRQLRVGEEIRHAIARMFERGDVPWPKDFSEPSFVTIPEVQISPDLRNATVFFSLMDQARENQAEKILNGMAGFFRHAIAKSVKLRYVPELRFKVDSSFAYAQKIETILSTPSVAKDLLSPKDNNDDEQEEGADK